jgi:NADPH-dependent curcumin reductase CurA
MNRQVRLAARPVGVPKAGDWEHTTESVGEPGRRRSAGRNHYLSLDPAMPGWMNAGRSYVPPVGIGEAMRAGAVGEVLASRHPGFRAGQHVVGPSGASCRRASRTSADL